MVFFCLFFPLSRAVSYLIVIIIESNWKVRASYREITARRAVKRRRNTGEKYNKLCVLCTLGHKTERRQRHRQRSSLTWPHGRRAKNSETRKVFRLRRGAPDPSPVPEIYYYYYFRITGVFFNY